MPLLTLMEGQRVFVTLPLGWAFQRVFGISVWTI